MRRPDDIPQFLRSRFRYDPETGVFHWKARPFCDFPNQRIGKNWNTRFAGKPAFTSLHGDGYTMVSLLVEGKQVRFFGHTAAFAISYGRMPKEELDHRNRDRADNRLENLREATRAQNNRNARKPSKYLAGAHPHGRKWEARICVDRVSRQIGVFATEAEAHEAYVTESRRLHGDFSAFADEVIA